MVETIMNKEYQAPNYRFSSRNLMAMDSMKETADCDIFYTVGRRSKKVIGCGAVDWRGAIGATRHGKDAASWCAWMVMALQGNRNCEEPGGGWCQKYRNING